jgi:DNA-directed RNA polymerase subunit RPC12/RpoP
MGVGMTIAVGFSLIFFGTLFYFFTMGAIGVDGAIIGVAPVVVGVLLILLSPLIGGLVESMRCPYCNTNVMLLAVQKSVKCGRCKKRLTVRDKQLEAVR